MEWLRRVGDTAILLLLLLSKLTCRTYVEDVVSIGSTWIEGYSVYLPSPLTEVVDECEV